MRFKEGSIVTLRESVFPSDVTPDTTGFRAKIIGKNTIEAIGKEWGEYEGWSFSVSPHWIKIDKTLKQSNHEQR